MKVFKRVFPKATHALRRAVYSRQFSNFVVEVHSPEEEVVIALGSNVGNRIHNFDKAISLMKKLGITITKHACLYETEPAYVTEQPLFLNSAIRGFTKLGPHELLKVLKQIEKEMGRTEGIRYGPRPMDLDVLFYGKYRIKSEILSVPHERIWERPFVVAPLIDLLGNTVDTDCAATWHSFSGQFGGISEVWKKLGGDSSIGKEGLRRVLPVGDQLWDWSKRTHVMGVLNLTPDSFSDGGKFISVDAAVAHVRLMISEGADIIDIGAQSTRPLAPKVSAEEELNRLMPVLKTILNIPEAEGKFFSVDTYYSEVASEVAAAGVHFVNDISGGRLDTNMFSVVAGLRSPFIMMHMRGNPSTMQNAENVSYEDVCKEVANELYSRVEEAELSGIPSWRIIIDPGIGFSKTVQQNLELLMGIQTIRKEIACKSLAVSHAPMLIGPSRKSFLGKICNRSDATERDPPTIASVTAGILAGANIIRVHNVKDNLDAAKKES
ncbi:unnamed protein product [Victoria cruziana]